MYTYEIKIGYSVVDAALHMTVPAVLDCFQDAAIFEAAFELMADCDRQAADTE